MNQCNTDNHYQSGFTLIELMIVISIIGVLASIAVPQYDNYIQRARFSEIISLTARSKTAVSLCAQENNSLDSCTPGTGLGKHPGIPPDISIATGSLATLITFKGKITATGTSKVDGYDYILTAVLNPESIVIWSVSGSCAGAKLC